MPLMPGVYLGAYEVLQLIGAGGMGEVYKARDIASRSHGRDQGSLPGVRRRSRPARAVRA